ncbi:Motile sperm domain-containing protein 2-like protein [Leptotrombidium deliense]|uniref:Motile sperm domain-containing protein 2-like protein n=1 Tax=Leptotrombidium deliense TaxID=299467 RepID=A0A443SA35_9ACAR|nr:Motile sperm domain-containing protein 2-like protein [Leptotrombidium deliense]
MAFSVKLRRQLTNSSIRSISEESVEYYTLVEVQNRLLKVYEEDNTIFEASDVKKIVESFAYLRRFAQRQDGNAEKTFEMVKNTLIWRKEMKTPLIKDDIIPLEFYDLGAAFIHGIDLDGNVILNVRAKYAILNDKVRNAIERWLAFTMFKVVEMSMHSGKGWTLLADLTGISVTQYDLPEILWVLKVVVNYMPAGIKSVIVYNLPWFAKPFVKIVMAFIPREWKKLIHFVGHKELLKLIPKDFIPGYIENPNMQFCAPVPPDAKPLSDIDLMYLNTDRDDLINFMHNILAKVK